MKKKMKNFKKKIKLKIIKIKVFVIDILGE